MKLCTCALTGTQCAAFECYRKSVSLCDKSVCLCGKLVSLCDKSVSLCGKYMKFSLILGSNLTSTAAYHRRYIIMINFNEHLFFVKCIYVNCISFLQ